MEDRALQYAKRATAAVLSNAYKSLTTTSITAVSMNGHAATMGARFSVCNCLGTHSCQSFNNRISQSKLKLIHKFDTLLNRGICLQVS